MNSKAKKEIKHFRQKNKQKIKVSENEKFTVQGKERKRDGKKAENKMKKWNFFLNE